MLAQVSGVLADERALRAAQLSLAVNAPHVAVEQELRRVRLVADGTHVVTVKMLRRDVILQRK